MIKARNISYSYSLEPILDHVSFSVGQDLKVGLVGPNGAGKSTLLKLIAGIDSPLHGKLEVTGRVGYVPQELKHDPLLEKSVSVASYMDPKGKKEEYELYEMMKGVELDISISQNPLSLSGGQRTKIALLRALIEEPDILLLDEPTNFLDIEGKRWVMKFLSHYSKTLLIISHDLDLMDRHIDKVIAINPSTKNVEEYKGTYSTYIKLKKEHDELLKRKILNEQKHIKRMEKGLLKMARYTSEKGVRRRTNLKRRIERLKESLPAMPKEIEKIKIALPQPSPIGELPIRAISISKSFNSESVLDNVSWTLYRGERVALIGPNGAGKSTFIKILMGILEPDSGEIVKDPNIKIGYYSQEFDDLDFSNTLIEAVENRCQIPEHKARPYLAKFNFQGNKIFQKIETLSGGEKTRLSIALLVYQNNNVLILDEPTTYLDILSQRIILDALKTYQGAMLFVSHTEDFVRELNPNRVLLLPENTVKHWIPELEDLVGIV